MFADMELSKFSSLFWTDPIWDEMELYRIKELRVRDILEKRHVQATIAQSCKCLECPNFLKHVSCLTFAPSACRISGTNAL